MQNFMKFISVRYVEAETLTGQRPGWYSGVLSYSKRPQIFAKRERQRERETERETETERERQ